MNTVNLTKDEIEILNSHNIFPDTFEGTINISINDPNIIVVRTEPRSWRVLAGSEWHLNRITKEWKLSIMS